MIVCLLITTIGNVGIWAIVVLMPAVQAEFGVGRAEASVPFMVTMFGFAAGNFTLGRVIDRYGAGATIIGATLLTCAATAAAATSPTILLLTTAQFVIGFGTAAGFGPMMADVSQWFLRRRGVAVAIVACGSYLAGAVWPMALTGQIGAGAWREAYLTIAAVVVVVNIPLAFLLFRRVPPEARVQADREASTRSQATGLSPTLITALLALAGLGCCIAMAMPQIHMVSLCVDLGFGAVVGGQLLAVMLVAGVFSRMFFGLVADRLGGTRTILISSGLQGIALLLYLPAGGLVSLYVVSIIFGLAQGGIVPSYTLVVREYMPSREAGRRIGFVMMATITGMAVGGWMSGWIYDLTGGYTLAFVNGIVWNVLNLLIIGLLIARARPGRPLVAA